MERNIVVTGHQATDDSWLFTATFQDLDDDGDLMGESDSSASIGATVGISPMQVFINGASIALGQIAEAQG